MFKNNINTICTSATHNEMCDIIGGLYFETENKPNCRTIEEVVSGGVI